ncbi:MAG: hypothetical protein LBE34_00335 [Flavobacteriaceae bacterium]|jgi:hypothetical protein|nr:hypothetical protein [Flavobacteriaceae bacterium]
MKKYYYYIIITFLSFSVLQAQQTQGGTYTLPLTGTSKPAGIVEEWDKGGSAPVGTERYTEEGIVLSHDRVGYSGFAIDDLTIDLRKGATIEFEYAMSKIYGTGYGPGGGMTFFIFDAEKTFKLGYGRSALGYAYNESNSTARLSGLAGGYLGVGFDLNGHFKGTGGMTAYEMRAGISEERYNVAGVIPGVFGNNYGSHITLRGAVQGMTGFNGNPVLFSQYQGGSISSSEITNAKLNYNTGEYDFGTINTNANFDIAEGGSSNAVNFQKVIIELVPNQEEGMYVTVKGNNGGSDMILIDSFYYKHSFKTYRVDGYASGGNLKETLYDFKTTIPEKVKIGFVGLSIDFAQQKTIIRNVKVTSPDIEEVGEKLEDTYEEICISDKANNSGANTKVKILESTNYNVNWDSFQFVDENGNELGKYLYENTFAKWEYSNYSKEVTITIRDGSFRPNEEVVVYYTVEIDGIRSKPAQIKVKGITCGAIANPQLRG